MPKVSVIIPVYNTEAYIEETLRSILSQTLVDVEVIVVDDGSTDGSRAVVARMAGADLRIKLHSQPNSGQAAARNRALDIATGEYIYFMDSDDLLEPDTLECCYTKCVAENLDFVLFDADIFGQDGFFEDNYYKRTHLLEERTYNGAELTKEMISKKIFRASSCLSLVRRDYLENIGLRYYERCRKHEDELFIFLMYVQAARIGVIPRVFFHRRLRPGSIMTSVFSRVNIESYFMVADKLREFSAISKDAEIKYIVKIFTEKMLNAALQKAHALPFHDKVWCISTAAARYVAMIKPRTWAMLLLKH